MIDKFNQMFNPNFLCTFDVFARYYHQFKVYTAGRKSRKSISVLKYLQHSLMMQIHKDTEKVFQSIVCKFRNKENLLSSLQHFD
jgi:hypothetical protein